jgi:hypothetical protein
MVRLRVLVCPHAIVPARSSPSARRRSPCFLFLLVALSASCYPPTFPSTHIPYGLQADIEVLVRTHLPFIDYLSMRMCAPSAAAHHAEGGRTAAGEVVTVLAFVAQANTLLLTTRVGLSDPGPGEPSHASSLFRVLEIALERTARYSGKGFCPASLPPVFRLVEVLVLVHKQLILPWDSHFEQTIDESRWSSLRDIFPRPRPVPSRAERRDTGWLQALLCGWMDSFDLPFSRVKTLHVEFLVHGRHREVDGETYDTQVRTQTCGEQEKSETERE